MTEEKEASYDENLLSHQIKLYEDSLFSEREELLFERWDRQDDIKKAQEDLNAVGE